MKKFFGSLLLVVLSMGSFLAADVFHLPAGLKSLETVVVGDPGNQADDTGFGAVAYPYQIGKYEVTAAQFVEFMNAKAKTDPYGFRSNNTMETAGCGIVRSGENGSYTYQVPPELANVPVNHVSFWDACRFCNWLHNGQGDGDTEDGAYTLKGYLGLDGRKIKRNPGAKWFVPSEDEWYKAAYYDPKKPGGAGYWDYPTRSDTKPNRDFTSANAANWYDGNYLDPNRVVARTGDFAVLLPEVGRYLTEVGAFGQARSTYGTFDQAGNVYEWTEGLVGPFLRYFWGGSFATKDGGRNVRVANRDYSSQSEAEIIGFRIAGAVEGTGAVAPAKSDAKEVAQSGVVQFPRRPWPHPDTGKPFFPLGWFSGDAPGPAENTLSDLDDMAGEGANTVIFYTLLTDLDDDAMLQRNLVQIKQYLDRAHRNGIKVLLHCGFYGAHMRQDVAEIARQRKYVEVVSEHPALLGYQMYDEPEYKAGGGLKEEDQKNLQAFVEGLGKARAAIRQWDANRNHLMQVVFNLVPLSSWLDYLPAIDSFQVDRYPCGLNLPYFGHQGDWGPLIMAWSMAHGAAALKDHMHLHNPAPCMQGVGSSFTEEPTYPIGLWRDPLYEETRYMAYSSLTAGSWGVFHWRRGLCSPAIRRNVARLHAELRQLFPAFEQSYEKPPFTVRHNHDGITRDFLTDCISDISTLELEDEKNYYLIVADNTGVFEDVQLRLKLPGIKDTQTRDAAVLNEDWSRQIKYDEGTGEWVLATHQMCFGDVNIWVIPKAIPGGGTTPVVTAFIETWEAAATSRLHEGPWQLKSGVWGSVAQQDCRGAGRKYAVAPGEVSQLRRAVSFPGQDHVVLEGWLYDPGQGTHSLLGLASSALEDDASTIRIGATGQATYRVQCFDSQSSALRMREIDTGAPVEPGWHFIRLDLVRDIDVPNNSLAKWRIWNAARSVEKQGAFVLKFNVNAVTWATLGSNTASACGYGWDDIRIGSLADVGPPPALPTPKVTIIGTASSFLPGWDPAKFVDADDGSVYSSNGHETANATEWAALDLGGTYSVNALVIMPRPGGICFPIDYEIQYSTDMLTWSTVPGQVHTAQPRPEGLVMHAFAAAVRARGLRVYATGLGTDGPDNASGGHYFQLARLEVPRFKLDTQPWVRSAELRHKSVNSTGIFSAINLNREGAPTPKYLAEHPDYLANHPFDGVTVPILIDRDYTRSQGLISQARFAFHEIGMSSLPIPWSAVADTVADLKQVQWGHCTDNFMWYGVSNFTNQTTEDGDRAWWVAPDSADDWKVVVDNAAVAARIARETGLKGFLVDTEQYSKYPFGDKPEYPWGLGEAAVWKDRGRQWIEAVQGEYPDIVLQFFFSWGDEYHVWPNYQNLVPFMNGVLAGIRHPARIVHAFESTFWNGQARETPPGTIRHYPGDREPFINTRHVIRNVWREVSDNPTKYDDFVDVGMAAVMESDPWNLVSGQPSGFLGPDYLVHRNRSSWPSMPWSNLSATLAYSDKYVWTWSGPTDYPATSESLNPFLASIANQTFNTGTEAVPAFREDFAHDPMARGWYFDFSFMEIGRRKIPDDGPPQLVMTTDAVAYAWSLTDRAVHVRGNWTRGEFGEIEGLAAPQRRRFVRPVTPLTRNDDIQMEIDFTVDNFGKDATNPILLGLFHSEAATDAQAICLRIAGPTDITLDFAGDGLPWSLPLTPGEPLSVGRGYRLVVKYRGATRQVFGMLVDRSSRAEVCKATEALPATVGPFVLDEAGVAQREEAFAATADNSYRFRLERFQLNPPQSGETGN